MTRPTFRPDYGIEGYAPPRWTRRIAWCIGALLGFLALSAATAYVILALEAA
jgi:hypothetical protein